MKVSFSASQLSLLRRLEEYLHSAVYANYIRALPMRDAKLLVELYEQKFHQSVNLNCPRCMLDVCKQLGESYYNKKDKEDANKG